MSIFQSPSDAMPLAALEAAHSRESDCVQTMAMSMTSMPSMSSVSSVSSKPKKKRHNHNELERKRRHHQREILYELRDVIPTLHIVKPSTVLIMQKAKDYIDLLRRTIQEMDVEVNDLRRALVAAGYPLPMATMQQQQPLGGFTVSQPPFTNARHTPNMLSEQMLGIAPNGQLPIDQNTQLPFAAFGELALDRASFNPHDIDNISQLQSALSKDVSPDNRPLSPVSPYQLEQAQAQTYS